MKRFLILIGLVFTSPILAQAQNGGWQIPPGLTTPRALNTPGTPMNRANVDVWGNQWFTPPEGAAPYGAPVTSYFSSCTGTISTTARTAVKAAAGAGVRNYITSVSCNNSSLTGSTFTFSDGPGAVLHSGAVGVTTGSYVQTFPVALRGSANTDFSVTFGTAGASSICCANGYTSTR